jgi:hypothetical protein
LTGITLDCRSLALPLIRQLQVGQFYFDEWSEPQKLDSRPRRGQHSTGVDKIYRWFTEGFDTGDLKDAKALLDELSS